MLQAERPVRRGLPWRLAVPSTALVGARELVAPLRASAFIPALIFTGFAWIAVVEVVESHDHRLGLVLQLLLVVAAAGGLTVAARLRHVRAAEAAGVAHDLRGPLLTLQVNLELLAGDGFGALPEPARAAVLRAAATSARAAHVLDDALRRTVHQAVAAPVSGNADLDVVVREVLDALEVQVRSTGATVTLTPLPRVAGDSSALFRVFANLLQNALKYCQPDGLPSLAISAEVEGGWAIVSVSDDGIGIGGADRARVFEPHYRTAAGVARSGGAGLGLANAQRLIAAMGGTIWVDGEVERGTTIRLRLPLA